MFKPQAVSAFSDLIKTHLPANREKTVAVKMRIVSAASFQKEHLASNQSSPSRLAKTHVFAKSSQLPPTPALLENEKPGEADQVALVRHAWVLLRRTEKAVQIWLRPQDNDSKGGFDQLEGEYFQVVDHPTDFSGAACELSSMAIQDAARVTIHAKSLVDTNYHFGINSAQCLENVEVFPVECSIKGRSHHKHHHRMVFDIKGRAQHPGV